MVAVLTTNLLTWRNLSFSFYSSQGRQTSFPDHNADLIERLQASTENIATLEVSLPTFNYLREALVRSPFLSIS